MYFFSGADWCTKWMPAAPVMSTNCTVFAEDVVTLGELRRVSTSKPGSTSTIRFHLVRRLDGMRPPKATGAAKERPPQETQPVSSVARKRTSEPVGRRAGHRLRLLAQIARP